MTPSPNSWIDHTDRSPHSVRQLNRSPTTYSPTRFGFCSGSARNMHVSARGNDWVSPIGCFQLATGRPWCEWRFARGSRWTATAPGLPDLAGKQLDDDAARIIRSLIPLKRTPVVRAADDSADGPRNPRLASRTDPRHTEIAIEAAAGSRRG